MVRNIESGENRQDFSLSKRDAFYRQKLATKEQSDPPLTLGYLHDVEELVTAFRNLPDDKVDSYAGTVKGPDENSDTAMKLARLDQTIEAVLASYRRFHNTQREILPQTDSALDMQNHNQLEH